MSRTKLSPIQMMTLTSASILGVDILTIQNKLVSKAGQDAWISILLSGLLILFSGSLAYFLARQYPDKDLPEFFIQISGKFVGRLLILASNIYMVVYLGLAIKMFSQALLIFLMDRTPIIVLMLLTSMVTAYAVSKGIDTIGKVVDILFPITIVTIVAIMLLALPQAEPIRIQPILYNNADNVLKTVLPSFKQFTGYAFITYFMKHTRQSKSTYLWYLAGLLIPIISYVSLTVITIMVFGTKETTMITYPTLSLLMSIQFPATFLERLESFAAVFWIGIVFNAGAIFYYASVRNTMVFFSVPDKYLKLIIIGYVPLLLAIAHTENRRWEVINIIDRNNTLQSLLGLVIVPLLAGYTLLRIRRRRPNENEN